MTVGFKMGGQYGMVCWRVWSVGVVHTSVPGSAPAGLSVFICSSMNPMVCCLMTAMCDCSWWILALASANLASNSEFSADRASRAYKIYHNINTELGTAQH